MSTDVSSPSQSSRRCPYYVEEMFVEVFLPSHAYDDDERLRATLLQRIGTRKRQAFIETGWDLHSIHYQSSRLACGPERHRGRRKYRQWMTLPLHLLTRRRWKKHRKWRSIRFSCTSTDISLHTTSFDPNVALPLLLSDSNHNRCSAASQGDGTAPECLTFAIRQSPHLTKGSDHSRRVKTAAE